MSNSSGSRLPVAPSQNSFASQLFGGSDARRQAGRRCERRWVQDSRVNGGSAAQREGRSDRGREKKRTNEGQRVSFLSSLYAVLRRLRYAAIVWMAGPPRRWPETGFEEVRRIGTWQGVEKTERFRTEEDRSRTEGKSPGEEVRFRSANQANV
jgi:hypothetical protein